MRVVFILGYLFRARSQARGDLDTVGNGSNFHFHFSWGFFQVEFHLPADQDDIFR